MICSSRRYVDRYDFFVQGIHEERDGWTGFGGKGRGGAAEPVLFLDRNNILRRLRGFFCARVLWVLLSKIFTEDLPVSWSTKTTAGPPGWSFLRENATIQ